jgi:hypothetical protein
VELSLCPLDAHGISKGRSERRLDGVVEEFFGGECSDLCASHEPVDLEHVPLMHSGSFDEGQEERGSSERLAHDCGMVVQHL